MAACASPVPTRSALRPRARTIAVTGVLAASMWACAVAPQPKAGPYHPSDAPVTVTRIVHGSYLLDFAGTRILVDPWYYPRGLQQQREPLGLTPRRLPPLAAILITHGHGDHLDPRALAALDDRSVPVIVRAGLGEVVMRAGYQSVTELAWWETGRVGDVAIHAVPADHSTDENGYVLEHGRVTVYAGGDTRLFPGLTEIAARFPSVDVALLPIGGLRFFGVLTEMRPADAAQAARTLGPRRVIPTHYGATGPIPFYWRSGQPESQFLRAMTQAGLKDAVVVLAPGESWHYYPPE